MDRMLYGIMDNSSWFCSLNSLREHRMLKNNVVRDLGLDIYSVCIATFFTFSDVSSFGAG